MVKYANKALVQYSIMAIPLESVLCFQSKGMHLLNSTLKNGVSREEFFKNNCLAKTYN